MTDFRTAQRFLRCATQPQQRSTLWDDFTMRKERERNRNWTLLNSHTLLTFRLRPVDQCWQPHAQTEAEFPQPRTWENRGMHWKQVLTSPIYQQAAIYWAALGAMVCLEWFSGCDLPLLWLGNCWVSYAVTQPKPLSFDSKCENLAQDGLCDSKKYRALCTPCVYYWGKRAVQK